MFAFMEACRGGGIMGGFRGGNGGTFVSCDIGGRAPGNAAVPGGADCGGTSCELRRLRNGLVGFGGREGGAGFAGADAGPFAVNGLLSADGTRERFPRGEGEREFSSSGWAMTQYDQLYDHNACKTVSIENHASVTICKCTSNMPNSSCIHRQLAVFTWNETRTGGASAAVYLG